MEQTEANRWVLGWSSRASWEVYMCLLYAGIEQYRNVSGEFRDISFEPLEKWLQCHDELIQYLRTVRDKLLHPPNESYQFAIYRLSSIHGKAVMDRTVSVFSS